MKKKQMTMTMILSGFLILLFCFFTLKNWLNKAELSEGYEEINLKELEVYKESPNQTIIEINDPELESISIQDGKLKIKSTMKEIEKEIPNETITSIVSDSRCGYQLRSYLYILTNKNNVYKSALLRDEKSNILLEGFQEEWKKIYEGKEKEQISLIQLSSNIKYTTCGDSDVYLKINGKVTDFSGNPYTEAIPTKTFLIGENGTLKYNYDGILEFETDEGRIMKVKNNEGKEIKALLIGNLNDTTDYLLDEEENEYILKRDLYTEVYENNGILNITNKKKILKIGRQEYNYEKNGFPYEIIFKNNEKKQIMISNEFYSRYEKIN